jgi:hypothetical protein
MSLDFFDLAFLPFSNCVRQNVESHDMWNINVNSMHTLSVSTHTSNSLPPNDEHTLFTQRLENKITTISAKFVKADRA